MKYLVFVLTLSINFNCIAESYTFFNDVTLSISGKHLSSRLAANDKLSKLTVKLEDLGVNVSKNKSVNPRVSESLILIIKDRKLSSAHFDNVKPFILESLQQGMAVTYDEDIKLFTVVRQSDSALKSYDLFDIQPKINNLNSLEGNYIGNCIQGFSRGDDCQIVYEYKGLVISFKILKSALINKTKVINSINEKLGF